MKREGYKMTQNGTKQNNGGLRDNLTYNEGVQANTAFLNSLKNKLPEFFTADHYNEDGQLIESGFFDWEKFKTQFKENNLSTELTSGNQLDFIGKNYAKQQVGMRSTTVIVPDTEHNNQPENKDSHNLFFTGDNIEVLRHLQANYSGAVDFIYIDPPYNTGTDGFVYPDKFEYTDEQLKNMFGLNDESLTRLKSIQGTATHSAWLTFMYPRLQLAKYLLKPSGVIFISIDENEYANLKILMDEIFGEFSYLGDIIRKTRSSANDASNGFNQQHEYVFIYGRNSMYSQLHGEKKDSSKYKNPDNDAAGAWVKGDPSAKSGGTGTSFEIVNPKNGHVDTPPAGRYWAFSRSTFDEWVKSGKVVFLDQVKNNQRGFFVKKYLGELKNDFNTVNSLFGTDNKFMNQVATKYLRDELFDGKDYFSNPKPVEFIKSLIKYATDKDSIILDFFAGSGTTADAVMQLNKEDNGSRRYMMVQLPEPIKDDVLAFKDGFQTIDQITRERIKRAAKRIGDTSGFRHYRFVTPTVNTLDSIVFNDNIQLDMFDDMLTPFSSEKLTESHTLTTEKDDFPWHGYDLGTATTGAETILTTYLVNDNYSFDTSVSYIDFAGIRLPYVNEQRLYIIVANGQWGTIQTKDLVNKIGTNQLSVQTIVVYGYTFIMESLNELELAIKQLNSKVNLVVRY